MEIRFMGTGAADFSPLLETEYKDKLCCNARRSSAILINDHILVDCGPHVLDSFRIQGLDPSKVTDLLVTHFHSDHFDRANVEALAAMCKQPLRMWYRDSATPEPIANAAFYPVKPGESFETEDMTVLALAANHRAHPLHYDIEIGGKRLFYGTDGAWLLNETFYAMMKRSYECMILDATVGDYNGDYRLGEHNSIPMIRLMRESFRTQNVIAEQGRICLTHLARTLHPTHEENVNNLEKEGFTVAFDGLCLEV
jgi:phosphoribosyl 1,2-cyclic phosphodiesterase